MTGDLPPMARPRVAAGVLIQDHDGSVLLVKPTYKDGWDLPGGYVEPNESPAAAAARELHEELGLIQPTGRLLVIDWAPHPNEGDKLLFIFAGRALAASVLPMLVLQASEISEVRFWPLPSIPQITPARLTRRILLAHAVALQNQPGIYAENGRVVPDMLP